MTKVKLKDATRQLLKGAEDMLGVVTSMRKNADELTQAAKKLENKFLKEEEQRRAEEKQAEQRRLLSQHAKAYTMPDTDDVPAAVQPPAAKPVETKETPAVKQPEPAKEPVKVV